jgi:phosphinothricin acetyltransferase
MAEISLAPLTAGDWPHVHAIYADGIAGGNATFETTVPAWDDWDARHTTDCRLAARVDGIVVGWAALSPVSRRDAYRGVAEVSVYVARDAQGKGVGRTLLEGLIAAAEHAGYWTLQASVFPENVATLRLHARCGFREVGRRERIARHHGRWRDTLLLERRSSVIGAAPAQMDQRTTQ